jgi:hypothetical protein
LLHNPVAQDFFSGWHDLQPFGLTTASRVERFVEGDEEHLHATMTMQIIIKIANNMANIYSTEKYIFKYI